MANNICLRMPNWVGDIVMATPALHAIRKSFPESNISAVIDARMQKILHCSPDVDRLIPYHRDLSPPKTLQDFFHCVAEIRKGRNKISIVLPNSFSSALMMLLAGVPERIGYRRDCRSMLLSKALHRPASEDGRFKPAYMPGYYLKLCEAAGAGTDYDIHPRLAFSPTDRNAADEILKRAGIDPEGVFFAIHPCAGFGSSKLWPEHYHAALAEMLHDTYGDQIAFIGGEDATEMVSRIREAAAVPTVDLTACGIDLHLLKCVISRCRLLVSTDSGPRHYGIALDVPTVCIMGSTNPLYTDSGMPHDAVVRIDVDCGPCQKKRCPADHRCMLGISPAMVFEKCKQFIEGETC